MVTASFGTPSRYRAYVLCGVVALGCASPTSTELPLGTLFASIDGVEFAARRLVAATHIHGVLAIAAREEDGRTIYLTMVSPRREAIVAVGDGQQNSATTGYRVQHWSSNLSGGVGTVTLTTFAADRAEGTFTYTAIAVPGTPATGRRSVVGRFNVPFVIVE